MNWLIASAKAEPQSTMYLSPIPYGTCNRATKAMSSKLIMARPTWANLENSTALEVNICF